MCSLVCRPKATWGDHTSTGRVIIKRVNVFSMAKHHLGSSTKKVLLCIYHSLYKTYFSRSDLFVILAEKTKQKQTCIQIFCTVVLIICIMHEVIGSFRHTSLRKLLSKAKCLSFYRDLLAWIWRKNIHIFKVSKTKENPLDNNNCYFLLV